MSDEVYKATIAITVMGTAPTAADFQRQLESMSLEEIMMDADDGGMIAGTRTIERVEHVHRDQVADELQGVGNDGSFFDRELDEDDDGGEDGEEGENAP